jgi:hypothetical protein
MAWTDDVANLLYGQGGGLPQQPQSGLLGSLASLPQSLGQLYGQAYNAVSPYTPAGQGWGAPPKMAAPPQPQQQQPMTPMAPPQMTPPPMGQAAPGFRFGAFR